MYRSSFLPSFLGVWLIINGFAYLAMSLPAYCYRSTRTIQEVFARLPPNPGQDQEPIEIELNYGELMLTINSGRKGNRAPVVRGIASGADDTEQKIRAIVNRKKKQVRKATTPVLLAISTSPFGEREDITTTLSHTFIHVVLVQTD